MHENTFWAIVAIGFFLLLGFLYYISYAGNSQQLIIEQARYHDSMMVIKARIDSAHK